MFPYLYKNRQTRQNISVLKAKHGLNLIRLTLIFKFVFISSCFNLTDRRETFRFNKIVSFSWMGVQRISATVVDVSINTMKKTFYVSFNFRHAFFKLKVYKKILREAVYWELLFVSMFIFIHAALKLGRYKKLKSKVVCIVFIYT